MGAWDRGGEKGESNVCEKRGLRGLDFELTLCSDKVTAHLQLLYPCYRKNKIISLNYTPRYLQNLELKIYLTNKL